MFKPVDLSSSFAKDEEKVLEFWKEHDVFKNPSLSAQLIMNSYSMMALRLQRDCHTMVTLFQGQSKT